MSSSCTPSSKTLSGIETSSSNGELSGGAAGQVPYQSAPGITTFSNATSGVLENISNVVNFTATPTTIRKISTPASQDLDLEATTVTKKIKLATNVGDISFSVDSGATEALVVKSDSTLQTQISSATFLRTDALGVIEAGSGGLPSSSLLGGAAGKVPYQSATNVTTFSNASNGVLENIANSVNFSNTPTTIQSVTAPIASNLTFTTPTVANNILLKTNGGAINLNTNNGGLNAWSIAATTGDLTSAISNILLTGGDVTVSNSGYISSLGPGELFIEFSGQRVYLNENEMQLTGQDFLFKAVTATKLLRLRTNAGAICLNTNNGGTDAWTIAATTGHLESATSNINLIGGNVYNVSNGTNSSQLSPAQLNLAFATGFVNIYGNTFQITTSDYIFETLSFGNNLSFRTNNGDITFSIGVTSVFKIDALNRVFLPSIPNATYLKTDAFGYNY